MNCRRWSSLALATLTMYCMMRPAFAQLGENAVTVPIEVQQQIASHLPLTKPNRILQRYVVTEDLNNKTRGSTSTSDVRAELYLLDNGLTGFVRSSVARSGAVQGNGQGITLCGLVSLIVETGMNVASTVPIIAGKLFIPYGMKSDTQLNARFRLVSFSSDISTICAPSPNTEFLYKTETEYTSKVGAGIFGRESKGRLSHTGRCKVAVEPFPANKVSPSLVGEALAVSCTVERSSGNKITNEYLFLRELSYYLPMEQFDGAFHTIQRYSEIHHTQP